MAFSVAQWLVQALQSRLDIRAFFGVSGANIEDLVRFLPIEQTTLAKHEASSAYMADGYFRASGRVAGVFATSGGGALNLLPALAEAYTSRIPMVVIIGQPPVALEGKGAFQETSGKAGTFSLLDVLKPVCRYVTSVRSIEELPEQIEQARVAMDAHPRGPVVLLVPKNILTQEARTDEEPTQSAHPHRNDEAGEKTANEPCWDEIARELKAAASGLVFIAGEGVAFENCENDFVRLVERLNARSVVTLGARFAVQESASGYSGLLGVIHQPDALAEVCRASVVCVVGSKLAATDRFGWDANVWSIHTEASFISARELRVVSIKEALDRLNQALDRIEGDQQIESVNFSAKAELAPLHPELAHSPLKLSDLAPELQPLLANGPVNCIVDAGNAASAWVRDLESTGQGRFIMAMGMGGMGYSFGAGIGAHLSNQLPTIVFAGDGSFFMHGLEIHTAVEKRLPILYILADNRAHAMCITRERLYHRSETGLNRFAAPVDLARGLQAMFPEVEVHAAATCNELRQSVGVLLQRTQNPASLGPAVLVLKLDADQWPAFGPFMKESSL